MSQTHSRRSLACWSDRAAKRLLDVGGASLLMLALAPVFILVAALIAVTTPGPVFYRQKRVGRRGREFDICKFRTMRVDADRHGPSVTSADDTRITPTGRFLRQSKLDELPQLLNVLRGDMSLVGPRPQVPRYVDHFDPARREIVLGVRPGVTGATALVFRNEERLLANKQDREGFYIGSVLPLKLELDAHYVRHRSFGKDLYILAATVWLLSLSLLRRLPLLQRRVGRVLPAPLPAPRLWDRPWKADLRQDSLDAA